MEKWNAIRSAYYVVRLGTVSAAADALGVHRATVIRHIDALEEELGQKIFQRHARGYTPTDVGEDLLHVAEAADLQFNDFVGRTKAQATALSGELIVTSVQLALAVAMPVIVAFRRQHPEVVVRYDVSPRVYRLEYGEAHVAIRAGNKPDGPDEVVRFGANIEFGLYASRAYAADFGIPETDEELARHAFVAVDIDAVRTPFHRWMARKVPRDRIIFRSTSPAAVEEAVIGGAGIGFLPVHRAALRNDLVVVRPYRRPWYVTCWLVTHVDLHRSAKVQAFLRAFRPQEEDEVSDQPAGSEVEL